jgi:hypothetical protein
LSKFAPKCLVLSVETITTTKGAPCDTTATSPAATVPTLPGVAGIAGLPVQDGNDPHERRDPHRAGGPRGSVLLRPARLSLRKMLVTAGVRH